MANRIMTRAEVEGARIWYSPSLEHWWMDPRDAQYARNLIVSSVDAINVVDAYQTLPKDFISRLIVEAGR